MATWCKASSREPSSESIQLVRKGRDHFVRVRSMKRVAADVRRLTLFRRQKPVRASLRRLLRHMVAMREELKKRLLLIVKHNSAGTKGDISSD